LENSNEVFIYKWSNKFRKIVALSNINISVIMKMIKKFDIFIEKRISAYAIKK